MSEVRITIGGRDYGVACAEGEEQHVASLGVMINEKLSQLGENLSPSESQNLLFGALFIADELHDTRQNADLAKAALEQQIQELEESGRQGKIAIGQRDELKLTIARLEEELSGIQSAQQRHNAEVDEIRTELRQRREEAEKAAAEQEELSTEIAKLTRERDNLQSKIENKDLLLERANDQMRVTSVKLEEALNSANVTAAGATATGLLGDPGLAPALERFADLLENCADKLEQQTRST